MEVKRTVRWLTYHRDAQAIITDSVHLLLKVESGMDCPGWYAVMHSLWLQSLLWVCCTDHTEVRGNEQADRPASTTHFTTLQLGSAEVYSGLKNRLNMDRRQLHSTDRLKEIVGWFVGWLLNVPATC